MLYLVEESKVSFCKSMAGVKEVMKKIYESNCISEDKFDRLIELYNRFNDEDVSEIFSPEELLELIGVDSIKNISKAKLYIIYNEAAKQIEVLEKIEKINSRTSVEEVNELLKPFAKEGSLNTIIFKLYKHDELKEAFEAYGNNRFNVGYACGWDD